MSVNLVYGLPGMGKTTWCHDFVSVHPQHRFFIVGRNKDWFGDSPHWKGKPPATMEVFYAGDEVYKPEEWPPSGVFLFMGWEATDVARLVKEVGWATFVDDEIDFSGTKRGWEDNPLREIVHQGRHLENSQGEFTECHILGACRRPQSLATDLTDIAIQVCIFRVQGKRTLQRLEDDSHIDDGDWQRIRTLPKWEFFHWPSMTYMRVRPIPGWKKHDAGSDGGGQTQEDIKDDARP